MEKNWRNAAWANKLCPTGAPRAAKEKQQVFLVELPNLDPHPPQENGGGGKQRLASGKFSHLIEVWELNILSSMLTLAPRVLHWCCLASIEAPESCGSHELCSRDKVHFTKVEGNETYPSHFTPFDGFGMDLHGDLCASKWWYQMVQALQQKHRLFFFKALFWTSWRWYWPSPVHRWCRQPQHLACPTAQTDQQDNEKSSFSIGNALDLVDFPLSF